MGAAELERGSPQTLLVIGGGIAGMTAAVEAAEVGRDVILVERNPYLGGRVAQFYHYFPKQCPPSCGLEINFRRIKQSDRIRVLTQARVAQVQGGPGNFQVTVAEQPRYVNERCTACGDCAQACELEVENDFEYGLGQRKAIDLPHAMAFPYRYHVDGRYVADERLQKAAAACQYEAVELDMQPRTHQFTVGAIVAATGWRALRREQAGQPRLRRQSRRGHQCRAGTSGRPGRTHRRQDRAPQRWRGHQQHRLRAVRRQPRREPPALLLGGLLPGQHEAGAVRARVPSRERRPHLLHRHPLRPVAWRTSTPRPRTTRRCTSTAARWPTWCARGTRSRWKPRTP